MEKQEFAKILKHLEVLRKGRQPSISQDRLLLFLLWPFAALIAALKNFRQPQARNIFWLFCVFFGFVFIYEDPALGKFGADSARYAAELIELHNAEEPLSFGMLLKSFYNPNSQEVDIYQALVTWFVSVFTDDPRVLFAFFAGIFGFFYSRNLWMVFDRVKRPVTVLIFLFMIYLALINPIWNINGVRMWTAAQVFIYGVLIYLLQSDKKGLYWVAASVLFHFSFMLPAGIFFVWIFLPRNINIYLVLYFITAFFYEINLLEARNLLSFLPPLFQPRVEGYTNEAYAEVLQAAKQVSAFHVKTAGLLTNWVMYGWILILFVKHREWKIFMPQTNNLFSLALLLGAFANIASGVPSGARYQVLSGFLFVVIIIILISHPKEFIYFPRLSLLTIPLLAYIVIFKIRMGLDYTGILTFVGNPIFAIFVENRIPLIDFIKRIL